MGHKAAGTICNINNAFGPGTANEWQCSSSLRSFVKETRALKMWSIAVSHQKLTKTNWEQSSKLILLQLHEKLLKNSMSTILQLFGIWSKLKRWKTLISEWPLELTENKKYHYFELSSSLSLCNNNEPFPGARLTLTLTWSALALLLCPATELVITSCHIQSAFLHTSWSDWKTVPYCIG